MSKCVVCNAVETDQLVFWVTNFPAQPVCEACRLQAVAEDNAKYKLDYAFVLQYLKSNHYKVVVRGYDSLEYFEIGDRIMECVSIIRARMTDQGFVERWIDIDWPEFDGRAVEVVTYLWFIKKGTQGATRKTERAFWIRLAQDT